MLPTGPHDARRLFAASLAILLMLLADRGRHAQAGLRSGAAATAARNTGVTIANNNACAQCHAIESVLSHPTDITPSLAMNVPADLPLSNGQITCETCHRADPLTHTRQGGAATATASALLRADYTATSLCAACHTKSQVISASSPHALALGRAHLAWPADAHRPAAAPSPTAAEQNRSCLTCHDGLISSDISLGSLSATGAAPAEHPVGIDYAPLRPRAGHALDAIPLAPRSALDPRIRLPDGQVACTSCHSLYAREKGLLVMSNLQSRLCLSCHRD